MAVLTLKFLGGFEAWRSSGEVTEIPIRKGQALLAYLALHPGQAVVRARLTGLLWGDRDEAQARTSLRQTLTILRRALGPAQARVLRADRHSIGLDGAGVEVDAVSFQNLIAGGTPAGLEAAVSLYRSDLLDGLEFPDPDFQAWLEAERRRFRELMAGAVNAVMAQKRADGARQDAIFLGQRLLTLDPLREDAHRALMVLYAELGQRNAAVQQYHRCRQLLESELGVDPETETEALYQALQNNRAAVNGEPEAPDPALMNPPERDDGDLSSVDDRFSRSSSARINVLKGPWRRSVAAAIILIVGCVAALGSLQFSAPIFEPASQDRMAFPLPDKPSIAVLAFANLSGDPEQDYFVDGVTDDLIAELSRLDVLFVISRNSSFSYRNKAVDIRQVAEDLGVQYVLEGSVRSTGDRIRINVQLVDAITGAYVWAEAYDEPSADFFTVQDKIALRVAGALAGQMAIERWMHQARRETDSLAAYQAFMRAKWLSRRPDGYTVENFTQRIGHLSEALTLDPDYARAHAQLGGTYLEIAIENWAATFGMTRDEAISRAKHHFELAKAYPTRELHYFLAKLYGLDGRHDLSIAEARKMFVLDKNDILAHKTLGRALNRAGRPAETIELMKLALRIDPRGDDQGWLSYRLGEALYLTGRYPEAVEALERSAERNQNEWSYLYLGAAYGQAGRFEEGKNAIERFNTLRSQAGAPPSTVSSFDDSPYARRSDRERLKDGLRKAGMPEGELATAK